MIRLASLVRGSLILYNRIDDKLLIKVGDFGLSEDIYCTNYFRQGEGDSVKLPFKWMALESLLDGIFSEKTDVVSIMTLTKSSGLTSGRHWYNIQGGTGAIAT